MSSWIKTVGKIILGTAAALVAVSIVVMIINPEFSSASAQSSGIWSSILVIITLVITLLKNLIAFVGFITTAIKVLLVIVFVSLLVGVGLLVYRAMQEKKKSSD